MKIVLISPPFPNAVAPPLGLGYISSMLKQNGHDVVLLDAFNKSWEEIREFLISNRGDVYGISFTTSNRFDGFKLARLMKSINPDAKVITGGVHPTLCPEQCLNYCDIVVRGEGEHTVLDLINTVEENKDLTKVLGISFKKNGKIIHNTNRPFTENLDEFPFPDFSQFPPLDSYAPYEDLILDLGVYAKMNKAPMITSRGCPYRCIFCSSSNFWGHKFRFRSAKNVVDEVEWLNQDFKVDYIRFFDDNVTYNKKRLVEICQEIQRRKLDIVWRCEGRVNRIFVDFRTLQEMKKAGCHLIEYGIESGSQAGIDALKKDITLEEAERAIELTRKAGIAVKAFFIIGNPAETKKTIEKTRRFVQKNPPDILTLSLLQVYPGTALFELAKSQGLIDETIWSQDTGPSVRGHIYGLPRSYVPTYTGGLTEKEATKVVDLIESNFYIKKYLKNIHFLLNHMITNRRLFFYEVKNFGYYCKNFLSARK